MNEVYRDIEQHIPDLQRFARAIARDPTTAEDLVQESVCRALAKSHMYRQGTNLRAWLFTILHNQHISELRRGRRSGISVDPDDAASALATGPNQELSLTVSGLERAMSILPDEQRTLIELVALDGESYEDVARTSRLALGTVKSRVSRGRQKLRALLNGTATKAQMNAREPAPSPSDARAA